MILKKDEIEDRKIGKITKRDTDSSYQVEELLLNN